MFFHSFSALIWAKCQKWSKIDKIDRVGPMVFEFFDHFFPDFCCKLRKNMFFQKKCIFTCKTKKKIHFSLFLTIFEKTRFFKDLRAKSVFLFIFLSVFLIPMPLYGYFTVTNWGKFLEDFAFFSKETVFFYRLIFLK